MTSYETIFARRQVRKFQMAPLKPDTLQAIYNIVPDTTQLAGQNAKFELAYIGEMNGGNAPHYLLAYCDHSSAAYANVGFVLQLADLYIQSIGLGSGWFMNVKPKLNREDFCIALAFGRTDTPLRNGSKDFDRAPVEVISPVNDTISQAVRLAPSSLNSQPWKLEFQKGSVLVHDAGHGIKRVLLKNKLNKIDVGIAARHAALALEYAGNTIKNVIPRNHRGHFCIEISYC